MDYASRNISWPSKFLASYLDTALVAKRELGSYATTFAVKRLEVQNRSGQPATIGFGGRLKNDPTLWKAGQYVTGAPGTYTDDTTEAQNTTANDFALSTLVNNDGSIVLCQIPFNCLSVIVGTAGAGGAPVWDLEYSQAGGAWASLFTNAYSQPAFIATGEQLVWWAMPPDWAVTEAGHATGITVGYYGIRLRATTAPTVTAALATQLIPGIMVEATEAIADNAVALWEYQGLAEGLLPPQCDGLAVAMAGAGIPNNQNKVSCLYRLRG